VPLFTAKGARRSKVSAVVASCGEVKLGDRVRYEGRLYIVQGFTYASSPTQQVILEDEETRQTGPHKPGNDTPDLRASVRQGTPRGRGERGVVGGFGHLLAASS